MRASLASNLSCPPVHAPAAASGGSVIDVLVYDKIVNVDDSGSALDVARAVLLGQGFEVRVGDGRLEAIAPSIWFGRHPPIVGASTVRIDATPSGVRLVAHRRGAAILAGFTVGLPPLLILALVAQAGRWHDFWRLVAPWCAIGPLMAFVIWRRTTVALDRLAQNMRNASS